MGLKPANKGFHQKRQDARANSQVPDLRGSHKDCDSFFTGQERAGSSNYASGRVLPRHLMCARPGGQWPGFTAMPWTLNIMFSFADFKRYSLVPKGHYQSSSWQLMQHCCAICPAQLLFALELHANWPFEVEDVPPPTRDSSPLGGKTYWACRCV